MDCENAITNTADLEALVGTAHALVRSKIATRLDDLMKEFVRASPLVIVATSDEEGLIDVSPKGDPAGFVQITPEGDLLIPERPGNQMCLGFRNILHNGRIGLIFIAPNQRETLRIKGTATLHKDPEILDAMSVNRKPALLYTRVRVHECFIHCGKAMIRSHIWEPEKWASSQRSIGGRQLASVVGARTESEVAESAVRLENIYREELY